jgi:oxygen-dependent protoporphyrinogen oxidase
MVFPIPPDKIHPAGFGYLVPRTADSVLFPPIDEQANPNPDGIIGVIFDSNSLSGVEESSLVETHLTKLTVMMGGPHWSSYPSYPADPASSPLQIPKEEDLAEKAMAHLSKVFPGIPQPVLTESTLQRECIPTYLVGHGQRMRELHNKLRTSDWSDRLILTGSSYGGVGVNDCVGMAEQTVADLVSSWTEDPPTKPPVTGLERWKDWD